MELTSLAIEIISRTHVKVKELDVLLHLTLHVGVQAHSIFLKEISSKKISRD